MSIYYIESELNKNTIIKDLEHIDDILKNMDLTKITNTDLLLKLVKFIKYLCNCYELNILGQGIEIEFKKIINVFNAAQFPKYDETTLKTVNENDDLDYPNELLYSIIYFNFINPPLNCGTLLSQYQRFINEMTNPENKIN